MATVKIISDKCKKSEIKYEIISAIRQCSKRGLKETTKWLAQLSFSLDCEAEKPSKEYISKHYDSSIQIDEEPRITPNSRDNDLYELAKSYFDVAEYKRSAHVLREANTEPSYFLHVYSRYFAAVRKHQLGSINNHGTSERSLGKVEELKILRSELAQKFKRGKLDSFLLYLYGVVIRKTSKMSMDADRDEAVNVFVLSVNKYPMNWAAWKELSMLVVDQQSLSSMDLPRHWMKDFFVGKTNVDLMNADEALAVYELLSKAGFRGSSHVRTQEAMAHHNRRVFDEAIAILEEEHEKDPYRLDEMDTLSNMYYVNRQKAELANLAHHCSEVDKFREETCCIIGNYYSLRSSNEKAVLYFQRALRLNPNYLSAWTLMGHEFTEIKNTAAAIQAYRNAVDLNRRDYRAWYGLGQTYELLKMSSYSLYYYKQAHRLRPFDSRMLMALGETYEALELPQEAKMCYRKALAVGDIEGMANIKLAKLYNSEGGGEWASHYYQRYAEQSEKRGVVEGTDAHTEAFSFLAKYHLKSNVDAAAYYAHKCCEYPEVREEAKSILRQISQMRGKGDKPTPSGGIPLDDISVDEMETHSPANVAPIKLSFSPGQSDTSNLQ